MNAGADALANLAATLHPAASQLDAKIVERAVQQIHSSKIWQRAMIAMMDLRSKLDTAHPDHAGRVSKVKKQGPSDKQVQAKTARQQARKESAADSYPWKEDIDSQAGLGETWFSNTVPPALHPTVVDKRALKAVKWGDDVKTFKSGVLYLQRLKWRECAVGVSWIEIAVDFEASVGEPLARLTGRSLTDRAFLVRKWLYRVASLCHSSFLPPGCESQGTTRPRTLYRLGFRITAGVFRWRPIFLCVEAVHRCIRHALAISDARLECIWSPYQEDADATVEAAMPVLPRTLVPLRATGGQDEVFDRHEQRRLQFNANATPAQHQLGPWEPLPEGAQLIHRLCHCTKCGKDIRVGQMVKQCRLPCSQGAADVSHLPQHARPPQ